MIARLLGAVQFLTIVPVPTHTARLGQSALFFPLVGAALGATGGLALEGLRLVIPSGLAAALVLCGWAVATGGLHEDGLADMADAYRKNRARDRILAILKDSRVGSHAVVALVLLEIVRWQALSTAVAHPVRALAAVLAISRSAMVALAWICAPAGGGLGFEFSRTLTSVTALAVIVQAIFWSYFSGCAVLLLWGSTVIVVAASRYFRLRTGGVTGDGLGAICLLVESWGLVLIACARCT